MNERYAETLREHNTPHNTMIAEVTFLPMFQGGPFYECLATIWAMLGAPA